MNNDPSQPTRGHGDRRRKSQNHSEIADARTTLVKKIMDDERKALDARTAKLRTQRLAKEEEDRVRIAASLAPAPSQGRHSKTKPASGIHLG